jgi:hypothetical protein
MKMSSPQLKGEKEEEGVYILIECIVLSQAGKEIGYLVSVNYKALSCHIPSPRTDGPLFDLTGQLYLITSFYSSFVHDFQIR